MSFNLIKKSEFDKVKTFSGEWATKMELFADMFNTIELVRAQIYDLIALLPDEKDEEVRSAARNLDKKLIAIEDNLIQRKRTGQGQEFVRWPCQLYFKIVSHSH